MEDIPMFASMFVYIDFALAVNKRALFGRQSFLISWIKVVESFKKESTKWTSSFIL
jgi:hypothetical protein